MAKCNRCQRTNPDEAKFCMSCGNRLTAQHSTDADVRKPGLDGNKSAGQDGNWQLFWITLIGSLLISWLLFAVFHLPIFILGAILPLFWFSRKK